jgi:hypothetical protein
MDQLLAGDGEVWIDERPRVGTRGQTGGRVRKMRKV